MSVDDARTILAYVQSEDLSPLDQALVSLALYSVQRIKQLEDEIEELQELGGL